MSLIHHGRERATLQEEAISDSVSVSLLESNEFIDLVKGTPRFGL